MFSRPAIGPDGGRRKPTPARGAVYLLWWAVRRTTAPVHRSVVRSDLTPEPARVAPIPVVRTKPPGALVYEERWAREFYSTVWQGHCSPTNAWVEGILLDERRGTGDMPHGWAAAEHVFLHRNSLVFENADVLELCWGVQPEWLNEGAKVSVTNAPTQFGKLAFEASRKGSELVLSYRLAGGDAPAPRTVQLHIPRLKDPISSVVVNARRITLKPVQSVVSIA